MTEYFRKRVVAGYEADLLRDILSRMGKKQVKVALDYFNNLYDRNEAIKKNNAGVPASKAKELLIIPGLEAKVEGLILALHFLLRYVYPSFRTPPPLRFANEQVKAAAKQDWSAFARSFANERVFYGRFLSFSRRIAALVMTRRDEQAYVDALVTEDTRRRKDLFVVLGHAAISLLAGGYIGYAIMSESVGMQDILTPRPDAVHEVVQAYREADLLHETESERRLEQRYGFNILGDFTDEDLNEIERVLATRYNRQRLYDLGLRTIVVIAGQYSDRVDYAGQSRFGEGAIRLFSGNVSDTGIFEHELAHLRANHLGGRDSSFWTEWDRIAGPYNKVIFRRGTAARGDIALVQHYVDGSGIALPRFGYARAYGGVDHQEDIGMMVQAIKADPHHFARVQESFDLYLAKFAFLERHGFITRGEHERVRHIVDGARQQSSLRAAQ